MDQQYNCTIHGIPEFQYVENLRERIERLEFDVRILKGEKLVKPELTKDQMSWFIGFTLGSGISISDFEVYKKGWYYFESDRKVNDETKRD